MLVLAGKQAQPPTPHHHPVAVVMQPHFLPSVPLLLTQSCWQQNMLPLVLLCLITSCVGCGGHCVHVQLCTCIVAYNKVVCACSEPALHTLFILCVWLCCKFVCPRCPWRSILCILSLMKAPKRERGAYGGGGGIGGGSRRVFSPVATLQSLSWQGCAGPWPGSREISLQRPAYALTALITLRPLVSMTTGPSLIREREVENNTHAHTHTRMHARTPLCTLSTHGSCLFSLSRPAAFFRWFGWGWVRMKKEMFRSLVKIRRTWPRKMKMKL